MLKLLRRMRRRELITAALCALLVLGQIYFDLALPDYMTDLTTLIKTPGSLPDIAAVGGRMLLCALASAVLAITAGFLAARTAAGFSFSIREELFRHVMTLGSAEMQEFSVPSLITRTTNDITQIQMVIAMGLQMVIKAPMMAVWAVAKILGKSWELSAVTAAVVVVLCVTILCVLRVCLPRFRIVQKLTDQINRVARENLTGINVVHAFNAEDYQNEKFDGYSRDMMNTQMKNQKLFSLIQPVLSLGMNGLSLAVYWVGAALVQRTADAAGRLAMFTNVVVFSTYAMYVVMSFMMLVMIFMLAPAAQVSAERIGRVLEAQPSVTPGQVQDAPEAGTVEFRDVSFRYPGAQDDALSHISFRVGKGQTLAIIGATGSGKSTLIGLIPRFYDVTGGQVLVDGRDVREFTFDALYDRLGYVTQRATLFSGTVQSNVFFGSGCAPETDETLQKALDLSQAAEFVVFDDSFSALDYRTDAKLRAGLAAQMAGVTKVIVAQRISTIRHADEILVLERGEIVGRGTHEELLRSCEVYREIASSQLSQQEQQEGGAAHEA